MRKSYAFGLASCAVVSVVTLSATALGDEDKTGFEIGFRTGYSIALGNFAGGGNSDLSNLISGTVPLWLDLGGRVTPSVMVGLFGVYGFGFTGDTLDNVCQLVNGDCSVHDIRFGGEVQYHFLPFQKVDPWIGAGFGYEWLSLSASALGVSGSGTVHGFQFLNLQGGVDFSPNEDSGFGFGPFLDFAIGEYSGGSCSGAGFNLSCNIDDKAVHEWLTIGVRGTFVP